MAREVEIALYQSGKSISQIAAETSTPLSTVRFRLKAAGVLRARADGVRLAATDGRLGGGLRGKQRVFSPSHKQAIRESRIAWGIANARGTRVTSSGYGEYTRGPHKGRRIHDVAMEARIGRRLLADEVVHHIDGDKLNNNINNLALLTISGHTRLHRREKRLLKMEKI